MAHKVADAVYCAITGEGAFDSRVVYVRKRAPRNDRANGWPVMDLMIGANVRYLPQLGSIVLAPRFSPSGDSYFVQPAMSGFRDLCLDIGSVQRRVLEAPKHAK